MKLIEIIRLAVLIAMAVVFPAHRMNAWEPLRVHPQNPYILEFRGHPTLLQTFAQHYSAAINPDFEYLPYLDVLQRDGMNLTRVFLAGFRHTGDGVTPDPLAPSPAAFLQPWLRSREHGNALDGLGKWDLFTWDEAYFTRLRSYVQACGERGIVIEASFFCTFYSEAQWQASPFNPANNVQGYGPASRYDCWRPADPDLMVVQEATVRKIVNELNDYDNIYYEVLNEPFWNEPGIKDDQEVDFHNRMLAIIRDEEAALPYRHLVAHNFPQLADALSTDFGIINEHYPVAAPGTPIAGAEALLRDHYSRGLILSLDETSTTSALQARLESWMFLLGGGGIYNGLDVAHWIYSVEDESGDSELGRAIRASVRNIGRYAGNLHLPALRRDLAWVTAGIPAGATIQAMASPGQQYVAYFHHGQTSGSDPTGYEPIDGSDHTIIAVVTLAEGTWRAVWTRPADLMELGAETFTHPGGNRPLTPVIYQEDVALRIDRMDDGDTTPPPWPVGVVAVPNADGSISLEWNPVQSSDLAFYHVYRSEEAGVLIDDAHRIAISTAAETHIEDLSPEVGTTHHYVVTAVDARGNESSASTEAAATSSLKNLPYGGIVWKIPGVIQAENFDTGGQGLAYHDLTPANDGGEYRITEGVDIEITTDEGEGYQVTATETGEWLKYTVNVTKSAGFIPELRVANPSAGAAVHFEIDGIDVTGQILIPESGGVGDWQTVVMPETEISAGQHVLRLAMTSASMGGIVGHLNWFALREVVKTGPTANAGPDQEILDPDGDGFGAVTLDASASLVGDAPIVSFHWMEGDRLLVQGVRPTLNLAAGDHTIRLIVTDSNGLEDADETLVKISSHEFLNGSFESGYTGWSASGNQGIYSTSPYLATNGSRVVAFNPADSMPNGVLSQTFTTLPGQSYLLSFDMGVLSFNKLEQRLEVEVVGGGGTLLLSRNFQLFGRGGGTNYWTAVNELPFTADSTTTTLVFRDKSPATNSLDLLLDNVRVASRAMSLVSDVSFPSIAGKSFIARFQIQPETGKSTVPRMNLKISGNTVREDIDLITTLPAGEDAVPYFIIFTADSATTKLRFSSLSGDIAVPSQILGLQVAEPASIPPASLPNARQLAQIDRRYGLFLHYGINTFTNKEWGDGTAPPTSYQPTDLDVEQWVRTACEAGMRYVLITSKHHDGFCIWDSPWTSYDVGSSAVKTDVIAAAAAACRKYDIKLAIYYSLWDRHEITYPVDESYNQFALRQLEELLGNYGPICELWLDGAWDKARDRWPIAEIYDLARRLQPDCQVSTNATIGHPSNPDSPVEPVNQQEGYPFRYFPADFRLYDPKLAKFPDPKIFSHSGNTYYLPFEATITLSASNNWFFHPTDVTNKSVSELVGIYQSATAQDNMLVLNAPPDRRGHVRDLERGTLFQLRDALGLGNRCSRPYGGSAWPVPGIIQAEDFDEGGQDVAYHDLSAGNEGGQYRAADGVDIEITTDEGGGYHVFKTEAGEWLKYTINVPSGGEYDLNLRTASSAAGGEVHVEVDGVNISGAISIPASGGTEIWHTVSVPGIELGAGEHILRLVISTDSASGAAVAVNWLSFTLPLQVGPLANAGPDQQRFDEDGNGFESVLLDGGASLPGISPLVSFAWSENGNGIASGKNPSIDLAVGLHTIRLTVTDSEDRQDTDEVVVNILSPGAIVNGSFEAGYDGWSASGNQEIQSSAPYAATDGVRLVAFNSRDSAPNGILSQKFATTAGLPYVLEFDMGVLAFNKKEQRLKVDVSGGGVLASQTFSLFGLGGGQIRWQARRITFTADNALTTITFRDVSPGTFSLDLLLDHVRVTHTEEAPVITGQPSNVSTTLGGDATFRVTAEGSGTLAYQWRFNGNAITGAQTDTLTVQSAGYADVGSYDVLVFNAVGQTFSNPAVLTISSTSLLNGGFESSYYGWMAGGNQMIASGAPGTIPEGVRYVAFNSGNAVPNGVLSQTFATTPGQTSTLSFHMGVLAYNKYEQRLGVEITGKTTLASHIFSMNGSGGGNTRWMEMTLSFTADSSATTLIFRDRSTTSNSIDLLLDNIRVTNQTASSAGFSQSSEHRSTSAAEPPSLSIARTPDAFKISMIAPEPGWYELQKSRDLGIWEPAGKTYHSGTGSIEFIDPSPAETRMFYRIALPRDP